MDTLSLHRAEQKLALYGNALKTLREAVYYDGNHAFLEDATIQRFEYTYELSWNAIKGALEINGTHLNQPKPLFREAFLNGWITKPDVWEDMIHDRNRTVHIYRQAYAKSIYKRICTEYLVLFEELYAHLSEVLLHERRNAQKGP